MAQAPVQRIVSRFVPSGYRRQQASQRCLEVPMGHRCSCGLPRGLAFTNGCQGCLPYEAGKVGACAHAANTSSRGKSAYERVQKRHAHVGRVGSHPRSGRSEDYAPLPRGQRRQPAACVEPKLPGPHTARLGKAAERTAAARQAHGATTNHVSALWRCYCSRAANKSHLVKASGPQHRGVDDVWSVRGSNDEDVATSIQAVQLSQQLVHHPLTNTSRARTRTPAQSLAHTYHVSTGPSARARSLHTLTCVVPERRVHRRRQHRVPMPSPW